MATIKVHESAGIICKYLLGLIRPQTTKHLKDAELIELLTGSIKLCSKYGAKRVVEELKIDLRNVKRNASRTRY